MGTRYRMTMVQSFLHPTRPIVNLTAYRTSQSLRLCHGLSSPSIFHGARQKPAVLSAALQGPPELLIGTWTGSLTEERALEELRKVMQATPYRDRIDDEMLKWFLLDRKMDWEEAQEKLIAMLKWRERIGSDYLKTTDIAKEAATGKAYLHTHSDVLGRPVLIVRASRHVMGASPLKSSEQLCSYLIDRAIESMPPGQNAMLGVFDLRGFSSRNADLQFARFMIDAFFTYYPKRVSQVLMVEAPWVFQPVYSVVKPLLRKYAALVQFVSVDDIRRKYFTPETLPEDFRDTNFPKFSSQRQNGR